LEHGRRLACKLLQLAEEEEEEEEEEEPSGEERSSGPGCCHSPIFPACRKRRIGKNEFKRKIRRFHAKSQ